MKKLYDDFVEALGSEDMEKCFEITNILKQEEAFQLAEFYENYLTKALNSIECHLNDQKYCIWKEHVHSAIVRTLLENCFPYVLEHQKKYENPKIVVVICPDGEHHEIGARMSADFFRIEGFKTYFIGASTPKEDFIDVINTVKPAYVAISVTNSYNMVSAERTIALIRKQSKEPVKIILGGYALLTHPNILAQLGADRLIYQYKDIVSLGKEAYANEISTANR